MKRSWNRKKAFTLMEVMIVLGILLLLATISAVVYLKGIKPSTDKKSAKLMVDQVCQAVDLFHENMKRYPSVDEGLQVLIDGPADETEMTNWAKTLEAIPNDPWGNPIQYEPQEITSADDPGAKPYHVWSNGPDGQPGTDDDIRNWQDANATGQP